MAQNFRNEKGQNFRNRQQELLRHSSLRSTLDIYTQAISPAKHAAQAAVLELVFASETNSAARA
jgi:hypothetical protein